MEGFSLMTIFLLDKIKRYPKVDQKTKQEKEDWG